MVPNPLEPLILAEVGYVGCFARHQHLGSLSFKGDDAMRNIAANSEYCYKFGIGVQDSSPRAFWETRI